MTFDFSGAVYDGETSTIERDGFTLTATIHRDSDHGAPWDEEDGHGPVSDWRYASYWGHVYPQKAPGERVLVRDRGNARFYDFAEACRIARRDGWGVEGGKREGESDRAYAARAAEADFERLRRWCNDQWTYVGVAVTVECQGVRLTGDYDHALWGIESDSGAYFNEVAEDLAGEALKAARAKLAALCACGEAA